ncbi:hypothetical protein GW819_03365 [Candidatus Gracilibacteria bacterium]|nr:hypothetical protein [Candidatus Gracilibacteria bacterium]OIO76051.1 MAG: hypothetical protein AUJ87_03610 [Candidatus Gracilibacteria bacterium CG1_02_38_174]PIQ41994.1 MAG: hypothetical protein COW06_01155 [Candidatus Gracilibacteria bacterium CG12_big_fil_rev_8_21_14_0_65_38_15]
MKISIAFSGPAGSGINTCGTVLGNILSEYGYFVYGDKQYSSLIKGGNNLFVLYISDTHHFISRKIDHFIHFDALAREKNSQIYNFDTEYFIDKKEYKNQNTFALGLAAKILGIDKEVIENIFLKKLPEAVREDNRIALSQGFDSVSQSILNLKPLSEPKKFYFGNEAVSLGAMDSGLEFYSAYPMTPASSLIDVISEDPRVTFFQGEDEIAVAMSMLGAKFAGKRSMCGTSGGGFALMSESISFSNQAELGGVYVLSQRAGPSTGTPTFTGQSDLNYALNASFGDTFPIVFAPYTFENGYNLIGKALNWSDIYQHPVIFLVDKSFSEGYMSVDTTHLQAESIQKGKLENNPAPDFARYTEQSDGISPYSVPGTPNGEFIATSYEHDIYGKETEDNETKMQMEAKRFRKMETFVRDEFKNTPLTRGEEQSEGGLNKDFISTGYDIINPDAKKFFITYGINFYALQGFIHDHREDNWGIIVLKVIQPLDLRLKDFLESKSKDIEKLVFVEQNYSGQLETYLSPRLGLYKDTWQGKVSHLRSTSLYPIFEENICEKV